MVKTIVLILLTALILKKGVSGCLTFLVASMLIGVIGYNLFAENGLILAGVVCLVIALKQIFQGKLVD